MMSVTFVVTNVKLVVVHIFRFFNHPLKELPAGEGLTLFGWEIRPDLAGFHNIKIILLCKSDKLIICNLFNWLWSAKQPFSLRVHHRILCFTEDTFGVSDVKRIE